ncbi:MAG: c-type cytochrome [Pseudomonadales bacterium]|nr:c-type cytochrome [Pseudomonadales bacterium]
MMKLTKYNLLIFILFKLNPVGAFAEVSPPDNYEPIKPITKYTSPFPKAVSLGNKLFEDKILSKNDEISCSTCHKHSNWGADERSLSEGINDSLGVRNTPTVYNSGYNHTLFWDGRVTTLEEQALHPITNPIEMGNTINLLLHKLKKSPQYRREFNKAFDDGITVSNITFSLAEYQRTLTTPNSPFDRWLKGDTKAISIEAYQGYQLFKGLGCSSCHQGINVGGNLYQPLGILNHLSPNDHDLGRYNLSGDKDDFQVFRVPSLRNVAMTPPYLHNGSIADLESAILIMGELQLGITLSKEETRLIRIFLESLTGEQPSNDND